MDEVSVVRIVNGQIMKAPGVGPITEVYLPLHGQVLAKFPPSSVARLIPRSSATCL
ncbi:hypothetical protein [Actinomadura sp. NTSP31]|uniref:hypothetical protein n=1 Tax=Actinomadura sp. NTSP31 TaxID=1735447 RepID=UPI0035C00488